MWDIWRDRHYTGGVTRFRGKRDEFRISTQASKEGSYKQAARKGPTIIHMERLNNKQRAASNER